MEKNYHPSAVHLQLIHPLKVRVTFVEGITKEFDISTLFDEWPALKCLKEEKLFMKGHLDFGDAIVWSDEVDLSVWSVFEKGITIENPDDILMELIGGQVREERNKQFLTQKELAKKAGIHQGDLSKLEKGKLNPSIKLLNRISDALGKKLKIDLI